MTRFPKRRGAWAIDVLTRDGWQTVGHVIHERSAHRARIIGGSFLHRSDSQWTLYTVSPAYQSSTATEER